MPDKAVGRAITLVAATDTQLMPKSPTRTYALIVNDGVADMYLGMGFSAALNYGIRVNNGGGSYEINLMNPWQGEVRAISTGTPKILVVEW